MSINSNQVIKKPDVIIDPNFFLPPGVVDARYPDEIEVDQEETTDVIDTDDVIDVDSDTLSEVDEPEETGEDNETSVLLPPDTVIVVSQTIRVGENGQQVVDVVLEVPDVDESIQIDVRMTKV
ncbi:hypothetical protein SEA_SPILLED_65 [Streptomyces phage Spilled]|jgi:deoxycytidine triphosphate deaminase|uniref:Uncharacterized protein n=3 Tax=Streptomyces virus Karimac TaxID=2846401 RepID=A0A5Q2WN26_9CAUD|nr:hypothetical protein [Streptomyces sp. JV178]AXH66571.1 hypothetical protein SEA_STARBOW_62 [Streptomyces phage Starbow]QDF17237.1 hypothetical protein SEA_BIRCHLYN_61 [Streptomyces phage Birchlyn]QGH74308.1 hypothetical protein SEA_WIPEOUT_62 [Streptomyces phage Wipeout]QGH78949.1 hypothetical protein SEA_TOMSAWYER_62 [Streptomyces phage TomSawyer]QGH79834.1 hypothetical protein SEA_BORDEAUX_62 [Streptomyces phage Bordeaux]QPL13702.1 hypothetical protein SEA_MINDFLAYER_62 [Streptomyces ph